MNTTKTNLESKNFNLPLEFQQVLMEHSALSKLIKELIEIVEKRQQETAELRLEVKRLQDRLRLDSHNSSYPPSTDPGRKGQKRK